MYCPPLWANQNNSKKTNPPKSPVFYVTDVISIFQLNSMQNDFKIFSKIRQKPAKNMEEIRLTKKETPRDKKEIHFGGNFGKNSPTAFGMVLAEIAPILPAVFRISQKVMIF